MRNKKFSWLDIHIKYLIFALLLLAGIGISTFLLEKKSKDVQKTPLESSELLNKLSFSKDYFYEVHNSNTLTIYVEYPAMVPNYPKDSFSMKKAVKIYVTIEGLSGTNKVKTFLQHVEGNGCGSLKVCYARKISGNDKYELFQDGTQNDYANKNNKANKYYLFKAFDGQSILLEDSGEWSSRYRIKRNIDGYLLLDYHFPKNLEGNKTVTEKISHDFIVIDKVVTEFIKSHLKYEVFIKDNKNAN